ncbi:MAG: LCP family protein [Ruminococcus sp.]|nr:LCP family protein [Candidatus Copronaster equi]
MANKNHRFKTSKDSRKGEIRRFVLAFIAFAVVFGSVSFAVILKHNNVSLRDVFSKETTTESEQTTLEDVSTTLKAINGEKQILIYCSDENQKELFFLHVIDINLTKKTISIIPLNPDSKSSSGLSYQSILQKGDGRALANAVEKDGNFKIDRYIGSDENTFTLAINHLDGLEYDVQNRVEYRNKDYTIILTKGKQTIKGETLINYLRYCKSLSSDGMRIQGDIIASMLNQYVTEENIEDGSEFIKSVMSKLEPDTDISYIEAMQALPSVQSLFNNEEFKIKTVLNDSNID